MYTIVKKKRKIIMAYEKFTTSCSFVSLVEGEKNLLRLYRYMFLSELVSKSYNKYNNFKQHF